MSTRQSYRITGADLEDPQRAAEVLTAMLALIADRLDRIEGLRGKAEIRSTLQVVEDVQETVKIHGFGDLAP